MDDSAPRIVELEEKLMFAQRALDELSAVVVRQQDELERLNRELQAVRLLAERAIDVSGGPPDVKPPHY